MLSRIPVPIRLSLVYLIFAGTWIIFSGRFAEKLAAGNSDLLQKIEEYKGLFFVVLSTIFLFFISRSMYRKMVQSLEEYKVMEKKNDALVTATKEGIYEYSIKDDLVILNPTLRQILGITHPNTIYNARKFWETHIHKDDLQRVLKQFDTAQKMGITYWREEYRALTETGAYRNVLHSVYILKDDWGVAYGVIGAIQDLTEFRQLEREYHEQQIKLKVELSRSIIQAEEKERNRWAEELHDNIAQVLSVASLYTGTLKTPGVDVTSVATKIKEMLELSVQEIRQLSANLKPPRFEDEKLREAIEMLLHYIKKVKPINFQLTIDPQAEIQLENEQKLTAYRIIQEQVNNIVKHADASIVTISLEIADGRAIITVIDDGKGFDQEQVNAGVGLRNIRSRLEVYQGELEIKSALGKGCELRAEFVI